ncbi:hypothetical protein EJ04DRAFT_276216 [Polyplosphaeria fusca]|uniref:Uncharacterized protein n=1 Tax=Polyplosphaeria fusca TaxID=682080 RepID=A0A9P4QY05_9PLEO|nr:hypothetical protein EJ04DRAFT_276216 [Polyplosphaeria fusca]
MPASPESSQREPHREETQTATSISEEAANTRPTPNDPGAALDIEVIDDHERIDILVYVFDSTSYIIEELQLNTLNALREFLTDDSRYGSDSTSLLLAEDISSEAIELIGASSNFHLGTASEHLKGRINCREEGSKERLHVEQMRTTLFDRVTQHEGQESITWWRLFTHSRTGSTHEMEALNECEADTRKVTVPHFELHLSDTLTKNRPTKSDIRSQGIAGALKHQWSEIKKRSISKKKPKKPKKPKTPQDARTNTGVSTLSAPEPSLTDNDHTIQDGDGSFHMAVHKIDLHTYRGHQVITEVHNELWGSAAEERVTFGNFTHHGSTHYIMFFDKPRCLQQYLQKVHIKDSEETSRPIADSFVKTGMSQATMKLVFSAFLAHEIESEIVVKSESRGMMKPTFLTAEARDAAQAKKKRRNGHLGSQEARKLVSALTHPTNPPQGRDQSKPRPHNVTMVESKKAWSYALPISTRARFIKEATNEGLFDGKKQIHQDQHEILRKAKLTFSRLIAEDWNLVLSQMSKTLDEIDLKMSDNTLLQNNALAWRRLLCSWRVSLVEYATRLSETRNFLQEQMESSAPYTSSPSLSYRHSPKAEPYRSRSPDDERFAYQKGGDTESTLRLYQILMDGLRIIETRLDRSFQAIMSSMSIIESERAITQGVAITRLTELAFFFIPLSFAATFFSMQVHVGTLSSSSRWAYIGGLIVCTSNA